MNFVMIDLENIDKTEHYRVPENYFEELPDRVMQNIRHEKHKRKTIISSAIAAVAMIAIAAVVFFTYNTPKGQENITQVQQTTLASEEEALESFATDYYSEELAMMDYYQYFEY
jgi:flagellar basal body-associated protein FliL